MQNDIATIDALKKGASYAQEELVRCYMERVRNLIFAIVQNMQDAEELTQDTFLKAFAAIDSYDPQRASLGTWLCRIAYRLTLDFLKRRRLFTVSIEDTEVWQTDISDEQLEAELSTGNEERIQRLELLIDSLPPDERLLLTLHYFESRTLEECSFIMDATPHALANRLYRIRKKLYKQLISNYENT